MANAGALIYLPTILFKTPERNSLVSAAVPRETCTHRVLLQKDASLHSINCSTACESLGHLKKRLHCPWLALPYYLHIRHEHPALGTSLWCSAAPPGSCREERDKCSPFQPQALHQYCSYVNRLESCTGKNKVMHSIKSAKKYISCDSKLIIITGHSSTNFPRLWGSVLMKLISTSPWTLEFYVAQTSHHLGVVSLDSLFLLLPLNFWRHLKNFST